MQLHRDHDLLRQSGAVLHIIGNGAPMFIAGFREETGYTGPLYTDPTLKAYEAAQLERGVLSTLNLASLGRSIGSLRRGFRQGRTQGDALQQGGVLVIAPGNRVLWQHVSRGPGDNATAAEIAAAIRGAA